MPFTFEQIFLAALLFYFLVHAFTCTAEIVHLKRTISEVPTVLREKISLAQHTKAARYDIARTKLNLMEVTVTTGVILFLTQFHGIDDLSELLFDQVGDQFAFHWMLPALIGLLFLIVDLPFSWYKEFRLREAYGYMREQPRLWFGRFALMSILGWLAALPILWVGLWLWRQSGAMWWIAGWIVFSAYLIFPLQLACRLRYSIRPTMAEKSDNDSLIDRLKKLGSRAGIQIEDIRVTDSQHNDQLPPAFAFGHRKKVHLFIRHDVYNKLSEDNLMAISAHALARNLSHMYFQAWAVCALVSLLVFMFLGWLAPQSWFLEEIGFKAIGPGPYYGSLLAFAIVALPVILFPFKLPMEAFLRHLIFRSDLFALHYAGLNSITNALIELTPTPIRHSCVTLEFFDLLFSHEPSLMARINRVQKDYMKLKNEHLERKKFESDLAKNRNITNVSSALDLHNKLQSLAEAEQQENKERALAYEKEAQLIAQANAERHDVTQPLASYIDTTEEMKALVLEQDNTQHRTYKMNLWQGFVDILQRLNQMQKAYRAQRKAQALARQQATNHSTLPVESVETTQESSAEASPLPEPIEVKDSEELVENDMSVATQEEKNQEEAETVTTEVIESEADTAASEESKLTLEREANQGQSNQEPLISSVSEVTDSNEELATKIDSENEAVASESAIEPQAEVKENTTDSKTQQTLTNEKVPAKATFKRPSSNRRKKALQQLRQRHSLFEEKQYEKVRKTNK